MEPIDPLEWILFRANVASKADILRLRSYGILWDGAVRRIHPALMETQLKDIQENK